MKTPLKAIDYFREIGIIGKLIECNSVSDGDVSLSESIPANNDAPEPRRRKLPFEE